MSKFFTLLGTICLLGTVALDAAPAPGKAARPRRPKANLLMKYDANQDGKLDQQEQKTLLENRPKEIEANYQKAVERAAKNRDRAQKQLKKLEKRFERAKGDIDLTKQPRPGKKGQKKVNKPIK